MNYYYLWPKCLFGLSISKLKSNTPKEQSRCHVRKPRHKVFSYGGCQGHLSCCYFSSWSSGVPWKPERWSSGTREYLFGSERGSGGIPFFSLHHWKCKWKCLKSGFLFPVLNTQSWGFCGLLSISNPWYTVYGDKMCPQKVNHTLLVMSPEWGKPSSFHSHFEWQ